MAEAAKILCAVGGVPWVSTSGPGKLVGEGVEEKVETPHQNHNVVGVTEEHYYH